MQLRGKTAVVYGGGGAIGGAVARAFAREGARVFLAGRTLPRLTAVATEITGTGGAVQTAEVDALDEQAVDRYADSVAEQAGGIDVSFNAIGVDAFQGTPLVEMSPDQFLDPVGSYLRTQFLTVRAAARHMAERRSGVILMITATPARLAFPMVGGFGVACAAIEGLCRSFAAELGPHGIRVVCLRSAGSPDAPGVAEAHRQVAESTGVTREELQASLADTTLLRRLPTTLEVANVAAFMASDGASSMTGTVANVTCGAIVD
jgi:NAD(P)-dependent dehydrogenase (short-subunit alcohol dehydrogenase family)